jgi:hypothetical protein
MSTSPIVKIVKEHYVCPGDKAFVVLDFSPYGKDFFSDMPADAPAWVTCTANPYVGFAQYLFTAPNTPGQTYYFNFAVKKQTTAGPMLFNAIVKIEVLAQCTQAIDNCCGDMYNIMWLNREGGIQNYYFKGVRTYDMRAGEVIKYIDANNISNYATRGNVYKAVVCTTGPITKYQADLLDSLQFAIKAYRLHDELIDLAGTMNLDDIEGTYTDILLDNQSYTKYKSRDKFYEVTIKFIYAVPVAVQKG